MVSIPVITSITIHLPTPDGRKAQLAWSLIVMFKKLMQDKREIVYL